MKFLMSHKRVLHIIENQDLVRTINFWKKCQRLLLTLWWGIRDIKKRQSSKRKIEEEVFLLLYISHESRSFCCHSWHTELHHFLMRSDDIIREGKKDEWYFEKNFLQLTTRESEKLVVVLHEINSETLHSLQEMTCWWDEIVRLLKILSSFSLQIISLCLTFKMKNSLSLFNIMLLNERHEIIVFIIRDCLQNQDEQCCICLEADLWVSFLRENEFLRRESHFEMTQQISSMIENFWSEKMFINLESQIADNTNT